MCQLEKLELALGHDSDVINAYNNMHVGYRVKVEWGMEMKTINEAMGFHKIQI
jgi:hypothetical protein